MILLLFLVKKIFLNYKGLNIKSLRKFYIIFANNIIFVFYFLKSSHWRLLFGYINKSQGKEFDSLSVKKFKMCLPKQNYTIIF